MPFLRFPDPPMPVHAVWNGNKIVSVFFDQPIADGQFETSTWSVSPDGGVDIVLVDVTEGLLRVVFDAQPPSVASVSYSPPPFDIVSAESGLAADAFTDFPVS